MYCGCKWLPPDIVSPTHRRHRDLDHAEAATKERLRGEPHLPIFGNAFQGDTDDEKGGEDVHVASEYGVSKASMCCQICRLGCSMMSVLLTCARSRRWTSLR
jgi:hypothetical protein